MLTEGNAEVTFKSSLFVRCAANSLGTHNVLANTHTCCLHTQFPPFCGETLDPGALRFGIGHYRQQHLQTVQTHMVYTYTKVNSIQYKKSPTIKKKIKSVKMISHKADVRAGYSLKCFNTRANMISEFRYRYQNFFQQLTIRNTNFFFSTNLFFFVILQNVSKYIFIPLWHSARSPLVPTVNIIFFFF